ncbi:hypothetical protein [Methanobacterium aggregans]|uniref:hypothetical protein n=1 Tax=Methanobacterium aggregans TaxID=1615586 RepID=UPI001AE37FF3|nr:hypothetical protein [Methanobacterium aggregans]MBP2045462.1 hypothetical protein [Methanobacterium aggregans]
MFLRAEPTNEVAKSLLCDFSDVDGLKEVVDSVLNLEDSEVYEKLVKIDMPVDSGVNLKENLNVTSLDEVAEDNLSNFPLRLPLTPLISIKDYFTVGFFVGAIYSVEIGHKLYEEDLSRVAHSKMIPRILSMLEDFNSNLETPLPTAEFFKRLGKVKWQDKKVKKFIEDLSNLHFILAFNKWGGKNVDWNFPITEKTFIKLLAGCSAVLDGRDRICVDDVVRANKTYLKLIDTDISEMV